MEKGEREEALRLWDQVKKDPESGWTWELDMSSESVHKLLYLLKRAGHVIKTETKRGNCGLVQEIRKATARIKL